jgi:type IV secretion system protein VirD4
MMVWETVMALGRWGQTHPRTIFGVMGGAFALGMVLRVVTGGHRRHRDMHGSARWATYGEVKRSGLSRTEGILVGVMQEQAFWDNGPKHVFLCGPTRAGKGVFHIQPTLARGWRHSALILDPKRGENYDLTREARESLGRVAAFAPYEMPLARINVLDTIRLGTLHEHADALTIAQSLTAPHKMLAENATSLHFRELAALLLTAALLHVCYTKPKRSLAAVWHFLTQQEDLAGCLQTMRRTKHTPHGVHPTIAEFTQAIRNITGDRELSSVWSTMIRPLSLYADPLIAASTDSSTVSLDDLQHGNEPLSLYLLAPSPRSLERLHPVYRVVVDVAMARLTDRPVSAEARRLLVCAEELPAYGYMHSINKGASDMAGYGIKGLFVAQDIDQFEDTYGQKNTIWGNTETKIFHAPDNERTAERISRFILGAATVDNPVQSRQGFLRDGSVSYQHVERPLLTTDEVQSLDPSRLIVRRTGSKPMLLYKLGFDPAKRKESAA